jgi:hypothetical protein
MAHNDEMVKVIKQSLGECRSTLRGRFFDVSKDKGKQEYAEWLADEIERVNDYASRRNRGEVKA